MLKDQPDRALAHLFQPNCPNALYLWHHHTHHCVSSSASPEHGGCWSSCCIVGKGRYWEFGGNWRQSLQRRYQVPSAVHCSNTSGGPEGSSHSCTISHTLYRGRCPLKHRDRHVKANLQQFCGVFSFDTWALSVAFMWPLKRLKSQRCKRIFCKEMYLLLKFSTFALHFFFMQFLTNPIPIGDISEGASGVFGTSEWSVHMHGSNNSFKWHFLLWCLHGNRDVSSRLVPFPQGQWKHCTIC